MTASEQFSDLRETLATLEDSLETPVVPGELKDWIQQVCDEGRRSATLVRQRIETLHRDHFARIEEGKVNLLCRVEQLRKEDERNLHHLQRFEHLLAHVCHLCGLVNQDEARVMPRVTELAQRGLHLVIRIRTQEIAVSTWLHEASHRDRGQGD